jgi:RimJ/RimL family protein N-acetyltransferase
MPDNYAIRALTENDWEPFAAIRLEALKNHPDFYASNYEKESKYTETEWKSWLTRQGKCVFGAFDDQALIGIAGVFPHIYEFPRLPDNSEPTGVMGAVYVKPDYRRQHLANKSGHACIEWSVEHAPWHKLAVSHCDGNEASRRMIEKLGFRLLDIERGRLWHGRVRDQYWYGIDLDQLRPQTSPRAVREASPHA